MKEIKKGKYRHYKNKLYEVIGVATHSETLEEYVVYKMLYEHQDYPKGSLWIRPKGMFLEKVEVNGRLVDRFTYEGD